jgi:GxxExxY protein
MKEDELSGIIIGHAIEVHKSLGPGLLESVYKQCLQYQLNTAGLFVEMERSLPVRYKGVMMECGYRIDLLVERKIVIETKSIEALADIHLAQTLTYLRIGNYKLGLLINFNSVLLKDGIKRVVNNL